MPLMRYTGNQNPSDPVRRLALAYDTDGSLVRSIEIGGPPEELTAEQIQFFATHGYNLEHVDEDVAPERCCVSCRFTLGRAADFSGAAHQTNSAHRRPDHQPHLAQRDHPDLGQRQ